MFFDKKGFIINLFVKNYFKTSNNEKLKQLIKKKQVNIYKFKNLQITINSPEELKYARLNYKKYFTI